FGTPPSELRVGAAVPTEKLCAGDVTLPPGPSFRTATEVTRGATNMPPGIVTFATVWVCMTTDIPPVALTTVTGTAACVRVAGNIAPSNITLLVERNGPPARMRSVDGLAAITDEGCTTLIAGMT